MVQRSKMMLAKDEELGKKDDDHKPVQSSTWHQWIRPFARKRRIAGLLVACYLVYLFIHNIPTDLKPLIQRPSYSGPQLDPRRPVQWRAKTPRPPPPPPLPENQPPPPGLAPNPPVGQSEITDTTVHYYEGPVKFYYLAATLHSVARLAGRRSADRNVLFAASDLQSAATIIPLACEMSRWKRNLVHMAFFGREEMSIEDLKTINGVDKTTCDIYWHDARPDYASSSSDKRMEISVAGALSHMDTFMHPKVLITADSKGEDDFFSQPVRTKATELGIPVLEIPSEGVEVLTWMTRLDANALHNWHSSGIDIIVQAPSESSGSMLRLLKSLQRADYTGFNPPRLTIELPTKMDPETESFINSFQWPPLKYQHYAHSNELTLRRRLPGREIDQEEAAIHFIESFYPTSVTGPHILLLSPQAELSPAFFHYLKYYLFEYKYTHLVGDSDYIMGISLETPSVYLNGSTTFVPLAESEDNVISPFLWQAPNSNAVLYFADKWMEVHSFLTRRHAALHHSRTKSHHEGRVKMISERLPAWTEYFLDLMVSRAYTIQYPGHTSLSAFSGEGLAIIHNELYHPPEEFTTVATRSKKSAPPLPTESVLTVNTDYLTTHQGPQDQPNNLELPLLQTLLTLLPPFPSLEAADGRRVPQDTSLQPEPVPPVSSLSLLDYNGVLSSQDMIYERGASIARNYRRTAGGCSEEEAKNQEQTLVTGSADDLFCIEDQTDDGQVARSDTTGSLSASSFSSSSSSSSSIVPATTTLPPVVARIFGSGGAASTVDRVVNPARYEETALAGFRNKLKNIQNPPVPVIGGPDAKELTPMESKELEDWQAEVRRVEKDGGSADDVEGARRKATPDRTTVRQGRIPVFEDSDPEPGSVRNFAEPVAPSDYQDEPARGVRSAVKQGRIPIYEDSDPEPGSVRNFPDHSNTQRKPASGGKLGRIAVLTEDDPEPGSSRRPSGAKSGAGTQTFDLPAVPAANADPDGDGRVRVEDLHVTVKSDGSAKVFDEDNDQEVVKLNPESASDLIPNTDATKTEHIPGSGGAAATIARVLDAAAYEATAKAGFFKKMKGTDQAVSPPKSDVVPEHSEEGTRTEKIPGSDGAASTIVRVVDGAKYQATAKAGFEQKVKGVKGLRSGEEVRAEEVETVAELREKDREEQRQQKGEQAVGT